MTARDWPKGPERDSLVQRRKEASGVSPEQARAPGKENLALEQEQELEGKQQEQEPEQEQELEGKQ